MKSLILTLMMSVVTSVALASGKIQAYSAEALKTAQMENKTVVLDFHADWCPTCKKQKALFMELEQDPSFQNVTILTVDFDKEKDLKAQYKVKKQSTLIVLKNGQEVAREGGLTDKMKIKNLVMKGM